MRSSGLVWRTAVIACSVIVSVIDALAFFLWARHHGAVPDATNSKAWILAESNNFLYHSQFPSGSESLSNLAAPPAPSSTTTRSTPALEQTPAPIHFRVAPDSLRSDARNHGEWTSPRSRHPVAVTVELWLRCQGLIVIRQNQNVSTTSQKIWFQTAFPMG